MNWLAARHGLRWATRGCSSALLTFATVTQAAEPVVIKSPEAAALVERMRLAAQQRSFSGTLVYTAADVVSSSKVTRFGAGESAVERVEVLDGHQQRTYRQNGTVHTVWPAQRLVTVERRTPIDETAGLPQLDARLTASYEVRHLGDERIVGRQAQVYLLKPRDQLRFGQRLWTDAATGMLLRMDVLSQEGKVLESTAFSNLELDAARPMRDAVLPGSVRREGYKTVQVNAESTTLEAAGWTAERLPAGFRLLGCVQRPLADPQEAADGKSQPALQAVFSDGVARVSVFIEPTDASKPRTPLMTHLGATHTLMKPVAGRWWLTVMGDVPVHTLKAFADAVSRKS